MAKTKLYKVTIKDLEDEKPVREIYVSAKHIMEATKKLVSELSVNEELRDIHQISEECYV